MQYQPALVAFFAPIKILAKKLLTTSDRHEGERFS